MKTLPPQEEFYPDAISLSAEAWINKYDIHEDYRSYIERFDCNRGALQFDSGLDIYPELLAHTDPKLVMALTRFFLLGVQIASEEKGNGGIPVKDIHFGIIDDSRIASYSPTTDEIFVTRACPQLSKMIEAAA